LWIGVNAHTAVKAAGGKMKRLQKRKILAAVPLREMPSE
jgi:hypothetical protein